MTQEYNGPKSNDMEDGMLVKVESIKCKVTESYAASLLQEQVRTENFVLARRI